MKALLVVPRLPGTGHTGDRLRAELHLSALVGAGFEVTLVGGGAAAAPPAIPGTSRVVAVAMGAGRIPLGLLKAAISGAPLQSALFAGPWRRALSGLSDTFDLVVVLLPQRLWTHVAPSLPKAPLVLDYVDALGAAARQAAAEDPALLRRLYWRIEAARLEGAERDSGAAARARFATTPFDASRLPGHTAAVGNGVILGEFVKGPRGPVVAFTGRLRYRPNALAAKRLLDRIWPAVRREVPEAELRLGGADAPADLLAWHGRGGVSVTSPVHEMASFLRAARAAAVPVDLGTGTPNKLFEAFEAGCAVVASAAAAERAADGSVQPPVRVADTDGDFAAALVDYLRHPEAAAADGEAGRAFVAAHADRRRCLAALQDGYRRAAGGPT